MLPQYICPEQHHLQHSITSTTNPTTTHSPQQLLQHPPAHSHNYSTVDVSGSDLNWHRPPAPHHRYHRPPAKMVATMDHQSPQIGGGIGGMGFNQTPLSELSIETRNQLAGMLNRKKFLHSEEGYARDWRGIAALAKQLGFVSENSDHPMDAVLNSWIERNATTADIGHLEQFLGIIDRWDVCDDIQENLLKDTQRYLTKQEQQQAVIKLVNQSPDPPSKIISCIEPNNNVHNNNNNNHNNSSSKVPTSMGQNVMILSEDDQKCVEMGLPLPRYNACVLYAEADIEHATEIMQNLESGRYNLKLFLRHRDMLMGVPFEHVQLSHFMATRCNHLIVVLTEEFLRSPENTYLVNFTQKIQIENHTRKIIPILYKSDLHVPQTLGIYTHIKYSGDSTLFNFWDKLARSLHDLDSSAIYGTQLPMTSSKEVAGSPQPQQPRVTTPTIRIQLNDCDISSTDLTNYKQSAASKSNSTLDDDSHLTLMSGDTSAPLPERKMKKKDKFLQKLTISFSTTPRNGTTVKPLRHAQSVSAINMERDRTLSASSSNISTTSESKKSSNKWRPKILKKVLFSRSSSKLPTATLS
ncbi:uncharacterized protein Myd88 [Drosophila tropicalis]|uniref:uncharacterized protein Myd88 n=1 Tax=Drosophila tropicalis TaxID=46794 RepID=UPI0035AC1EE5